jgi:two-component system, cell cycle response regulator DivK
MKTKVLIIEDNDQNIYLLTFLLEKHGYQVVQAKNGLDGIALAREESPDLVLLDIQLPFMDGYAVARELRKIEAMAKIQIIAVTSYAMPGDREHALEAGCSGYIEKPIDPNTFISQIENYLKSSSLGGQP